MRKLALLVLALLLLTSQVSAVYVRSWEKKVDGIEGGFPVIMPKIITAGNYFIPLCPIAGFYIFNESGVVYENKFSFIAEVVKKDDLLLINFHDSVVLFNFSGKVKRKTILRERYVGRISFLRYNPVVLSRSGMVRVFDTNGTLLWDKRFKYARGIVTCSNKLAVYGFSGNGSQVVIFDNSSELRLSFDGFVDEVKCAGDDLLILERNHSGSRLLSYSIEGTLNWVKNFDRSYIRLDVLSNRIYISDWRKDLLMIFDLNGNLLANLTISRITLSGFRPIRYEITENGIIMVWNDRVEIYSNDGKLMKTVSVGRKQVLGAQVYRNTVLIYGGSPTVKIPIEKPYGFVYVINGSKIELIEFANPVGFAGFVRGNLIVITIGYFQEKLDSPTEGLTYVPDYRIIFLRKATGGYVNVASNLEGDVYIDGNFVGKTPLRIGLIEGRHNVTVEAFGNKKSRIIDVNRGMDLNMTFDFAVGILNVSSDVRAWLKINNKSLGEIPGKFYLLPGNYNVTFYCFGCPGAMFYFGELYYGVRIEKNRTTTIFVNSSILRNPIGYLVFPVDTREVVIDDKHLQNVFMLPLNTGKHEIELYGRTLRVNLSENEILALKLNRSKKIQKTCTRTIMISSAPSSKILVITCLEIMLMLVLLFLILRKVIGIGEDI